MIKDKHLPERCLGYVIAICIYLMRATLIKRVINDPRYRLRKEHGRRYIAVILHAHQMAAVSMSEDKPGSLVSRSKDGEVLVPALRICGCTPIRGSKGTASKGGGTALTQMIRFIRSDRSIVIAADGPRGPRGVVQPGVAMLAEMTGAPILPVVMVAKRRWVFRRTWDRFQCVLPFSMVECRFGEPIFAVRGGCRDAVIASVERQLAALEVQVDPDQAALNASRCKADADKNQVIADRRAA